MGSGQIRPGWLVVGVAAVVVLVGWVLNDNGTSALTTSLLAAIPLLSLTVLLGYAGQASLAQITLSGVGGLIAARLAANVGLPFPVVLVLGMLATVPVGLAVGLPSARTRGVSLAIATLGLAVAIQALVFDNDSISGGQAGIALPNSGSFSAFGMDFDSFLHVDRFAYLVLGFVLVLALLVANLRRSASGRRMIAVRGNERAAAGLGINVVATKLWAFGIAAAITGVGGVLAVYSTPAALFSNSSVLDNINALAYSVVGGAGSVVGALFGSTLQPSGIGQAALNAIFGVGPVTMALIGGVLLLITIITSPDGMAAATAETIGSIRRRLPTRRRTPRRREQAYLERGSEAPQRVTPVPLAVGVDRGRVRRRTSGRRRRPSRRTGRGRRCRGCQRGRKNHPHRRHHRVRPQQWHGRRSVGKIYPQYHRTRGRRAGRCSLLAEPRADRGSVGSRQPARGLGFGPVVVGPSRSRVAKARETDRGHAPRDRCACA